jgi:hypothetical protein
LALRKLVEQLAHAQALLPQRVGAAGLLGRLRHQIGELLQAFDIACRQVVGKAIAKVPCRHGRHGQHGKQHGGQQQQ